MDSKVALTQNRQGVKSVLNGIDPLQYLAEHLKRDGRRKQAETTAEVEIIAVVMTFTADGPWDASPRVLDVKRPEPKECLAVCERKGIGVAMGDEDLAIPKRDSWGEPQLGEAGIQLLVPPGVLFVGDVKP
jgi:hypothetical protein